jgi:hypothetical protein
MAVRYLRSGDARANSIHAWSAMNLVTPVAGVQAVVVPEHAAGGTNAEQPAEVLKTAPARLQHRDRALTLRDVEQVALAASSQVVQAAASRDASGAVRVVVVGRVPDQIPKRATLREVRAALLRASPPELACPGKLVVEKPDALHIRVEIKVLIADVEDAGRLAGEATKRVAKLFDALEGGVDGAGWALGARPEYPDFAAVLTDLDGLEGIADIQCAVKTEERGLVPLPTKLRRNQLVLLDPGDIEMSFELTQDEVSA